MNYIYISNVSRIHPVNSFHSTQFHVLFFNTWMELDDFVRLYRNKCKGRARIFQDIRIHGAQSRVKRGLPSCAFQSLPSERSRFKRGRTFSG